MRYDLDQRTGQRCPECGSEIVYNGNYFCENYTYDVSPRCTWAMSEDDDSMFDACYAGLMANRENMKKRDSRGAILFGHVWRSPTGTFEDLRKRAVKDLEESGRRPTYSFTTGRDEAGLWLRFERTI